MTNENKAQGGHGGQQQDGGQGGQQGNPGQGGQGRPDQGGQRNSWSRWSAKKSRPG